MYKINDFSIVTGISKDTLRYYDKINFFKPSYVDIFSSYRYYEEKQIEEIKKISKLKELGLSLEEIKKYINANDSKILIDKRNELNNMIKKINEILDSNNKYTIINGDYKKYVEINGLKNATCPQGLEVRDNNALYFIVNKEDKFYIDFCVYKENNWLTLERKYLLDKELIDMIFKELVKLIKSIRIYMPVEDENAINFLINNYKDIKINDVKQGEWIYKQIEIQIDKQ